MQLTGAKTSLLFPIQLVSLNQVFKLLTKTHLCITSKHQKPAVRKTWRARREGDKQASSWPSSPDTDLFWEIPGRSGFLFRARWRPRRSPRPSWPRLWPVVSRCSPPCYLPLIPTGSSDGRREERWRKVNKEKTWIFIYSLIISCLYFKFVAYFPVNILHSFFFCINNSCSSHFAPSSDALFHISSHGSHLYIS